jgi:hypothetical protein
MRGHIRGIYATILSEESKGRFSDTISVERRHRLGHVEHERAARCASLSTVGTGRQRLPFSKDIKPVLTFVWRSEK